MHGVQITWKTFSCHHSKLKAPLMRNLVQKKNFLMFLKITVASKVNRANYGGLYIRVDTPLIRLFIIDWHCGCTPSVFFPNCRLVMIFSSTMLSNSYVDWCISLSYLPTHGLIHTLIYVLCHRLPVGGWWSRRPELRMQWRWVAQRLVVRFLWSKFVLFWQLDDLCYRVW